MIPLVFSNHEVDHIAKTIKKVKKEFCQKEGIPEASVWMQIGTMIETPRACIRADKIAESSMVEFMSFGTNDLTQLMLGLSRDDTQSFLVSLSVYIFFRF
jgi:pyruvate, orthophosphate dikinase